MPVSATSVSSGGGGKLTHASVANADATNRDLEDAVEKGEFREDLYYRLNVVTVMLPPLRERGSAAVALLTNHFLEKFGTEYKKDVTQLSPETMEAFTRYPWPGNVRELENLVRRMIVLENEPTIVEELQARGKTNGAAADADESLDLDALGADFQNGAQVDLKAIGKKAARMAEKRVIARVLEHTRWNRKEAAERLQISYKALLYKMKENGLYEGR